MGKEEKREAKISKEEFIKLAIVKLRKDGHKAVHNVYSGLNKAFEKYYNENPTQAVKELVEKGVICSRPTKGGFSLYLPEDAPVNSVENTLSKMGLGLK